MQSSQNDQPLDPEKQRKVKAYFSQKSNRGYKDIELPSLDDSDDFNRWLRSKQVGTNADPNRPRVQHIESPMSDYDIELTRIREPLTPASLSNLTLPNVEASDSETSNNVLTPAQMVKTTSPRITRRSTNNLTPSAIIRRKQKAVTNQFLAQEPRDSIGPFNPSMASTPFRAKGIPLISKLRQPENQIVSSSDEQIANVINARNEQDDGNRAAVEPVTTTNQNSIIVPSTQEHPDDENPNAINVIIPETQEPQENSANPVQAPVEKSMNQSNNFKQFNNSSIMENRTPQNTSKGIPPAWAHTKLFTPKTNRNHSSRIPLLIQKPTVTNASEVIQTPGSVQIPQPSEMTANQRSHRNDRNDDNNGQTVVINLTNPKTPPQSSTMPSVHVNVSINSAIPQSPKNTDTYVRTNGSSPKQPHPTSSLRNASNESLLTNDSDPTPPDDIDKENAIENGTPTPKHQSISVKRQLIQSFGRNEANDNPSNVSTKRRTIDNRTHTLDYDSDSMNSERRSKTFQYTESMRKHSLPPINSETFDKYASALQNGTYDVVNSKTSSRLTTGSQHTYNIIEDQVRTSMKANTINVESDSSDQQIVYEDEHVVASIDLTDVNLDSDEADDEVARVTGRPGLNAPSRSSNGSIIDLNEYDENGSSDRSSIVSSHQSNSMHESREEHVTNHTESSKKLSHSIHKEQSSHESSHDTVSNASSGQNHSHETQMEQNEIANKTLTEQILDGNVPTAWNPVVSLRQLSFDQLSQSRKSMNKSKIRESESFSHMVPPLDFRDEPIIHEKSPITAYREFNDRLSLIRMEQMALAAAPRPQSQPRKRKSKPINPELEAVNRTHDEIKKKRSTSPKRASKGRKLYTQQYEDAGESDIQTDDDNVFKIPSAPAPHKKQTQSNEMPSTSAAARQSATESEIITERTDSPIGYDDPSSSPEPARYDDADDEHQEIADNNDHQEIADNNDHQEVVVDEERIATQKEPVRKARTTYKKRTTRPTKRNTAGDICVSNIRDNTDSGDSTDTGVRRSKRVLPSPTKYSISNTRILSFQYILGKSVQNPKKKKTNKRKNTDTTDDDVEPPTKKKRSTTLSTKPTKSKQNQKQYLPIRGDVSNKTVDQICRQAKPWLNDLCNMARKEPIIENDEEPDIVVLDTNGKRIEIVKSNTVSYQDVSNGIDVGLFPSSSSDTFCGYLRFAPSAEKEVSTAQTRMRFFIVNGNFEAICDGKCIPLPSCACIVVKEGHDYGFKNISKEVGVLYFTAV